MYHQLTEPERYTLATLKKQGYSIRVVARMLGRSPSTVSREILRNRCETDGAYRPSKAQRRTNGRRRRSRSVRHHEQAIYTLIEDLLRGEQWSPEQVANRLADDGVARISHMTIYRYIREDALYGGDLRKSLRQGGKCRRKRTFGPEKRGRLQDKPMIDSRPEVVEGRTEPGHWEGDTVMGAADERDCLLTLVERSSGVALVAKLPNRTVKATNRAARKLIRESGLPFKTITWDNGTEFHGYKDLERATGVRCFFAYPHHPWQRGSNENFNGLLRQYFRKRCSLAHVRQRHCNVVARKLNHRPRKRYDYKTPIERLEALLGVLHFEC